MNKIKIISAIIVIIGIIGFVWDVFAMAGGAYQIADVMIIFIGLWINKEYGKRAEHGNYY